MKSIIYLLGIATLLSTGLTAQNVGIGTTNPLTTLHVNGLIRADVSATGGYILLTTPGTLPGMTIYSNDPDNYRADIYRSANALRFTARPSFGGTPPAGMALTNDGYLGIGTATPLTPLHVKGPTRVDVSTNGGYLVLSTPAAQTGVTFYSNNSANHRADIVRTNDALYFAAHASSGGPPPADMVLTNAGNVGIGTSTPAYVLHAVGRVKFDGATAGHWVEAGANDWFVGRNSTNGPNLRFYNGGFDWVSMTPTGSLDVMQSFYTGKGIVRIRPQDGNTEGGQLQLLGAANFAHWNMDNYGGNLRFFANSVERLRIHSTGKVSIGTNTIPGSHKLYVNGSVMATRVKVAVHASPDWADYVFDEDYELKTLEQVDQYIQANKHLPDVPSTEVMMESGNDLGRTDAILLSKIEELFLHSIEMNNQIKTLSHENGEMRQEMMSLKSHISRIEKENKSLKKNLER